MKHVQYHLTICSALVAVMLVVSPRMTGGVEPIPAEQITSPKHSFAPFAVAGSSRKPLPPLECALCPGPAPCLPCDAHVRGYLYYGAVPLAEDCANRLDSCSSLKSGQIAVGFSLAWIGVNRHFKQAAPGFQGRSCGCDDSCKNACRR